MPDGKLGGGRSNFAMTPVRHDGRSRKFERIGDIDIVGSHTGDYVGLNVANPQGGQVYQWVRNDSTARMIEMQKGGQPVLQGDPEFPAYQLGLSDDDSDRPTALDTATVFKDVVLFRYTEDNMAERHRQDAQRAEQAISRAGDQFLHGASPAELASSQGSRTRFARREHTLNMRDESGSVRRQWNPDRSILED